MDVLCRGWVCTHRCIPSRIPVPTTTIAGIDWREETSRSCGEQATTTTMRREECAPNPSCELVRPSRRHPKATWMLLPEILSSIGCRPPSTEDQEKASLTNG